MADAPTNRTASAAPTARFPWHAYVVLLRPSQIARALDAIRAARVVDPVPTLFQIELGVMRMWHRILFRADTIGTTSDFPVRDDRWARMLEKRWFRFPFLLREGSVVPWDLSGLLSTPQRLMTHLLGTHHDGLQFVYDMQMLTAYPGSLQELRDRAREVVERDTPRTRWLRNLCVYERYHETLLEVVERAAQDGISLPPDQADDPDISFLAYLRWCALQPATPRAAWRAWRDGRFTFAPGPLPSSSLAAGR
ncbi:MAG TPA: hypothetical protein VGR62_07740 [Candidatus Binatia bacterium]|jgi:hypothetical protein|nr:hypothetical protein [Candidatus Binatia bacterium]